MVDQQSRRRGEQADGGQGSGELLDMRGEVGVERTSKRRSKMPIIFGQTEVGIRKCGRLVSHV